MDTDPAIARNETYSSRIADINARVVSVISGRSDRKVDRLRALGVLGGIWRPARESNRADLEAHHDEIVVAAFAGLLNTADHTSPMCPALSTTRDGFAVWWCCRSHDTDRAPTS